MFREDTMAPDRDDGHSAARHQGLWTRLGSAQLLALAVLWTAANLVVQTIAYSLTGDMYAAVGAGGLVVVLLAVASCRLAGGSPASDFGLGRPAPGVLTLSILAACAALLPTSFLAGLSCGIHPPSAAWIAGYNEHFPDTPLRAAIALASVTVLGPLAEELVFRGLIFRLARRAWGPLAGAIISALIFGLAHGEPWFLFGLIGLGLLLAFVYELTGSLTACVVLHAVHNGISMALMFRQGSLIDPATLDAPVDWTLLSLSTAALIAVLWLISRRR